MTARWIVILAAAFAALAAQAADARPLQLVETPLLEPEVQAGKLPPVMLRLAEFFDSEVDQEIKTLSSMIEPLALIVMGGVVGKK